MLLSYMEVWDLAGQDMNLNDFPKPNQLWSIGSEVA